MAADTAFVVVAASVDDAFVAVVASAAFAVAVAAVFGDAVASAVRSVAAAVMGNLGIHTNPAPASLVLVGGVGAIAEVNSAAAELGTIAREDAEARAVVVVDVAVAWVDAVTWQGVVEVRLAGEDVVAPSVVGAGVAVVAVVEVVAVEVVEVSAVVVRYDLGVVAVAVLVGFVVGFVAGLLRMFLVPV